MSDYARAVAGGIKRADDIVRASSCAAERGADGASAPLLPRGDRSLFKLLFVKGIIPESWIRQSGRVRATADFAARTIHESNRRVATVSRTAGEFFETS